GKGVVDGELFDDVVTDKVGAAVAEAGDEELWAAPPQSHHDRRTHVLEIAVQRAHGDDLFVRLDDGFLYDAGALLFVGSGREVLPELAGPPLDSAFAGDLAGRLPAHAVRHDRHGHVRVLLGFDSVFVVFTVVAEQSALADVECQGHKPTSRAITELKGPQA